MEQACTGSETQKCHQLWQMSLSVTELFTACRALFV